MTTSGKRIVLTADRSLMTNYRGNFLYGFIACGPYELVPEFVFDKLFCPSVETKKDTGEIKVAQCGLRRIKSALLQEYPRNDIFLSDGLHMNAKGYAIWQKIIEPYLLKNK